MIKVNYLNSVHLKILTNFLEDLLNSINAIETRLMFVYTSTLRLLALRGLRTLRVRRVALRAPGVTQSNIFWNSFLYITIVNKGRQIISHMDLKI